jgi:hypothetical protein
MVYEPISGGGSGVSTTDDSDSSGSFWDQDVETSVGDDADPSDAGVTDNTPDDDGSSGYTSITNDGTDSTVNDADASDGGDGSDTWGNDSDGSDGGNGFDTDTSSDDSDVGEGTGGGYTTITNDGTESTIEDTEPTDGSDSSPASDGVWGENDGTAGGGSSDTAEQPDVEELLAEQRAAYEAQMASLMESMPVPDQLGGADSGGGLSPVLGGTALLLAGAGALYVGGGD